MPTFTVEELDIHFPFEPYEVQKDLMRKVVDCVTNRENGLLESPTGTGKTLSLLCASLAWQRREKALFRQSVIEAASKDMNAMKATFDPPKVIYASRTHSQLSQAMQELKRSFYKTSKAVVLGSRDLMCIHEEVSRLENSSAKILACHVKIHAHTCAYYNSINQKKEDPAVKGLTVVDIEDLVKQGRQARFCPFFMSRELVKEADIVFMPYNYLLDPKLRSSHGIDLKNSVIILDEGHNIAKICEEAVSFEVRSSLVALCIVEVTRAMNEFNEASQNQEPGSMGSGGLSKDLSLSSIMRLKQSFLKLEEGLDKVEGRKEGYLLPGDAILNIMSSAGFPSHYNARLAADLDNISSFLTGNSHEANGCDKFSSILRVLSSSVLTRSPRIFAQSYKVFIQLEESKTKRNDFLGTGKDAVPAKVFNFWCFNPAVGLETLMLNGPRCIMLASGTLSPIPFLVQELMVPFPVQLSNPHIIGDNQLFAGVFKVGPGEVRLSSSFQNRNDTSYLKSLGELIIKVCSVVPKGVLVFFPSYSVMELCSKAWQSTSIWEGISAHKKVLLEPRGKDAFKQVMDDYYYTVSSTSGACLMAVCRGKVSEGLDFTDDNGRAVIITGIPYSPARDPHVLAKQQYLDTKIRDGDKNTISGRVWYQLEATRALNQAIGRIIRHAQDYGAILLCDERCDALQFQQNLSEWVQRRTKSYENFGKGFQDLASFFGTSIQKERREAARIHLQKIKKPAASNLSKMRSTEIQHMSQSLYDATATDQKSMEELYGGECSIVEEFSSGRKVEAKMKNESPKAGTSSSKRFKKPQRKSLGLFTGLDSIAREKKPDFNFVAPSTSFSAPFRKHSHQGSSFENKRKKIKISSSNNAFSRTFSHYAARSNIIAAANGTEATTTEETTDTAAAGSGSGFCSIQEFWQWVKLSLETASYGTFIRGIKRYKADKDVDALANQLKASFMKELLPQCIQGMAMFLPKEELVNLRRSLDI